MVRVQIEVNRGDDRSTVAVRAESIRRALQTVGEHNPGCEARVVFPIDPGTFFVWDAVEETNSPEIEVAA